MRYISESLNNQTAGHRHPGIISLNQDTLYTLRLLAADAGIPVRISGNCMSPLMEDRSVILVQSRPRYWPGDILTFLNQDGHLTTHRLLGIFPRNRKLYCLTQPDNHPRPDVPVPVSHILGKVSGGDCTNEAIHIPWGARLVASKKFTMHVLRRLFLR